MKTAKELLKSKEIITGKKIGIRGGKFNENKKSELFSIFSDSSKNISKEEEIEYKKNKGIIFPCFFYVICILFIRVI
ncbi:MAG: hypothetical protein M0P94_05150 [Candidatus Absconditabacterales bacterium]|nr:hypothetical protein [Candidatus Absconditabacterales bacterium]